MLTFIVIKNLETGQINVNNAFTKSALKHFIYMNAFSLIDMKQREYLRLLQSLYDLKQVIHD